MSSLDPVSSLYPICTCVGFVLCLVPLPWHMQAWNSGTCAFMIWTAVACLIYFVDSLIWAGNVNNPAPIWCDIVSKVTIGVSIGIPAAILCISRRLCILTRLRPVSFTPNDKRRMVLVDLTLAAGFPFLITSLHYIVQPHRFDIYENVGCYPAIFNTLPTFFLYSMWPVVLGVISFGYSAMTVRSFWLRRAQFMQLVASNSSLSISRYLRLLALALVDMMCTVPLGVVTIVHGVNRGLAPWISWEDTHYNFSHVVLYPALIWRNNPLLRFGIEFTRWLPVFCAFVFFILFGFASEARNSYITAFRAIVKHVYPTQSQDKKNLKDMAGSKSINGQGLKPLKLVEQKHSSVAHSLSISNPVLVYASNPSVHTFIVPSSTQSTNHAFQLHTAESGASLAPFDTFSVSTSAYARSCDLMPSYSTSMASPISTATQQAGDQPPRLPGVPISPPLSTSPPSSPTPSIPESVGPILYRPLPLPGRLPSPTYHRPFCGPSIYPVTRPYPSAQQGVVISIHRQASVDEIV